MKAKNQIKTSLGSKIFDIFNYTFITLFCISVLFPVWNMIVTSLLRAEDISYLNLNLIPKNPTLDAYKYCFQDPLLWTALRNSVARTILGTLYHLLVCCMAAYALTYTEMPFIKPITVLFLITMYFKENPFTALLCLAVNGFLSFLRRRSDGNAAFSVASYLN